VAAMHSADVSLVDVEVQLECIRSPNDDQLTSSFYPSAELLLWPRGQNDAGDRTANERRANLLIEHAGLTSERVSAHPLQPFFGGGTSRRCRRRLTIGARGVRQRRVTRGPLLGVAQLHDRVTARDSCAFSNEDPLHDAVDERSDLGADVRPKH